MKQEIEIEIGHGLFNLGDVYEEELEIALGRITENYKSEWRDQVFEVVGGPRNKIAYLTGAYYRSIDIDDMLREGTHERVRDVYAGVPYADVAIESGEPNPRPVAGTAIEVAEPRTEQELDLAVARGTNKIERGWG